jgi:hypothetical protein
MPSLLLALLLLAEAPGEPTLTPAGFPAAGRHSARLSVPQFGRYAVSVKTEQGAALHLVDRMAGPGAAEGVAGEQDGRLDVFLERGDYRVVVDGAERARGNAALTVRPFRELHEQPPLLVELKALEGTLADLEQRSYWVQVEKPGTVIVEAAGRGLADLRFWRDGTWLVAAEPERERTEPRLGKPLNTCRLAAALEPGLYLLTAYGGPGLPWAEDDGGQPFHLRAGIPRLGEAGRQRFAMSPFGVDRYLAPGKVTLVRVEVPEARPLLVAAGEFERERPFAPQGPSGAIDKKSQPPVAELRLPSLKDADQVLAVTGEAGQPYVLQQFVETGPVAAVPPEPLWLGTIHGGAPEDSVDATGVLVRRHADGRHEVLQADVVELDASGVFSRRANLLGRVSLILHIREAGPYEVRLGGVNAQARLEPLFVVRGKDEQPPPLRPSGATWELVAGYARLTVEPIEKGVVDMSVRLKTLLGTARAAVGLETAAAARPVRAALRFPRVTGGGLLYLGEQPGVRVGLIARPLPLDLADPLFVAQQPGEAVLISFRAREAGRLAAVAEDGSTLEMSVDGGTWTPTPSVTAGAHEVAVRHTHTATTLYSVTLTPERLRSDAPLPPLPDTARATIPEFPPLMPGTPRFLDLERQRSATFKLVVPTPGLYELATTGLLATEAEVRTRTVPRLDGGEENGVGRNASVRQYLREGDYQLTVRTRGQSRGHLGVTAARTTLKRGGFLTNLVPARITLVPGEAVAYRFNVTKPGRFRLHALGLGRTFRSRLEDLQGWPVVAPGTEADLTLDLPPGKYRFIVLPETTEARVVTQITPIATPVQRAGHGPHALRLGSRQTHLWTEPEEGKDRAPDVWQFTVTAPVTAALELTGEMQGDLLRLEGETETEVATVPPGAGWRGALGMGRYRLKVVCSRTNNRAAYTVALWPEELVAGLSREVTAPAELPVSVGEGTLYEISTLGQVDVAARLFDAQGALLASSDDRPDDWNAHLALALPPGRYNLRLDVVGGTSGATRVVMRRPEEKVQPALTPPAALDLNPARAAYVWPLSIPPGADVLSAAARSEESVGLALEASVAGRWQTVARDDGRRARVESALAPAATAWRLRAWSLDRRAAPVHLEVAALEATPADEAALGRGVALRAGAVRVRLARPGVLRVADGLRACPQPVVACGPAQGLLAVPGPDAWILGEAGAVARAERALLQAGAPLTVATPEGAPLTIDVAEAQGPRVVLAESHAGAPGVAFDARSARFAPLGLSAVSATLTGARAVLAWPASGPSRQEIRITLRAAGEPAAVEALKDGTAGGALPRGGARAVELGGGRKRVTVALGEGVVGALTRGRELVGVVAGGASARTETLETEADRATLLAPEAEGHFSMEAVPLGDAAPTRVALGAAFEADLGAAGWLRLPVAAAPGARMHVRGGAGDAVFVGEDGLVVRGLDAPIEGPGTLLVPHGPGLLLAWLDTDQAEGPWPPSQAANPQSVKLPASVRPGGQAHALQIDLAAPAMLHVRGAERAVTLLRRPGTRAQVQVGAEGTRLDAFVPAGRTELVVRAVGGGVLAGRLDVTATPVTAVTEGLGPEVLLAPGASRLFSFETTHEGPVGVAVRASADTVDVTLMDAAGAEVGRGAAQMPTLKPGRYLLALSARADGPTVRARPALAGLVLPDTGPPDDVARRYLEPEDPAPEFSARRSATPWGMEALEDGDGEGEDGAAEGEVEETEPEEEEEEAPDPGQEPSAVRALRPREHMGRS